MAAAPEREPLLAADGTGDNYEVNQHAVSRQAPPAANTSAPPPLGGGITAASLGVLGSASWLPSLTFSWVSPLLKRGSAQEQMHQRDLFDLPHSLLPAVCGQRLWHCWHQEQERCRARNAAAPAKPRSPSPPPVPPPAAPSLMRAIVAAYGRPYFLLGLLKAVGDALNFTGPLLLSLLLRHLATHPSSTSSSKQGGQHPSPPQRPQPLMLMPGLGWHVEVDVASPLFGYACAALLAGSLVMKAFIGAHYGYRQSLISSQLRSAVTVAVFRKALTVNAATLAATGSGRVQTLMSVDADRLVNLCLSFHELWSLPLQIAIALWLLYTQVQYAFVAGLGLVLALIPINRVLANRIQAASVQMMGAKDRRVRVMLEVLRGIRAIKAYAWEQLFARKVRRQRADELAALAVRKYLDALCVYFWAATSLLFSLVTFGLYALMGRQLTPQVVFTSLALFNVLLAPINAFPWVINGVVEAVVSVRRLSDFLCCPETSGPSPGTLAWKNSVGFSTTGSDGSQVLNHSKGAQVADAGALPAAILAAGSYSWGGSDSRQSEGGTGATPAQLTQAAEAQLAAAVARGGGGAQVNVGLLSLPSGSLVALTGPVGSGKSSLLAAFLGEMLPVSQSAQASSPQQPGSCGEGSVSGSGGMGDASCGCVAAGSSVAYASQDPWAMNATLRDNILLGQQCDRQRYEAVLHACALLPDVAALLAGDLTIVGGSGSTLSGGQRARLALARALYKDADVLLLDDCLAAVDARVAAWILRHALLGPLLWGQPGQGQQHQQQEGGQGRRPRTVVVATHSPQLLAAADWVVEMAGGRVAAVRQQPDAAERRREAVAAAAAVEKESLSVAGAGAGAGAGAAGQGGDLAAAADGGGVLQEGEATWQHGPQQAKQQGQEQEQEQEEEERQQGHVRWSVYHQYAAATGWGWVLLILGSLALMQATRNGNDLWLSRWVSHTVQPPQHAQHAQHAQQWVLHPLTSPPDTSTTNNSSGNASGSGSGGGSSVHGTLLGSAGSLWCAGGIDAHSSAVPLPACTPGSWAAASGTPVLTAAAAGAASVEGSGGGSGWVDPDVRYYLTVLLAIAGANSIITLVRAFSFAKGGLVAAKRVHEQLLTAVLALPQAFFDATPPGRVLNRFSSDTATVDDSLPFILNILLANCASLAGVAAVLCLTQPLVLALLPPLGLLYRHLQRYYRATSRELRRLDAVAKSPVYTAFSEALSGGPTIRAFAAQPHFLAAAEAAVAAQQRASVAGAAAGSWLGLRLQLMAAALAAAVAVAAVAEHAGALPWGRAVLGLALASAGAAGGTLGVGSSGGSGSGSMAAGLVGLSLSYVLPITGLLSSLLTSSAETEQEMVAAERVFQYLQLRGNSANDTSSGSHAGPAGAAGRGALGVSVAAADAAADAASDHAGGTSIDCDLEGGLQQPLLQSLEAPAIKGPQASSAYSGSGSGSWLQHGHVRFDNVWLRYEPWRSGGGGSTAGASSPAAADGSNGGSSSGRSPWVLRGMTLDVPPGSHVGICGRTGAGKSSLLSALLRLVPITRGSITIDGHDVSSIPPHALRRAVGVVPQHPFLFEGSIRQNLDPLSQHTTAELAAVLHQVQLWQPLLALLLPRNGGRVRTAAGETAGESSSAGSSGTSRPHSMQKQPGPDQRLLGQAQVLLGAGVEEQQQQQEVEQVLAVRLGEGSAALSQGQQQLLALARVLLRRPRLLLLDEATSSVDPATADTMHQVIRCHLAGSTILEVAHRQSTIQFCPTVVVMEEGRIAEQRAGA